jgi:hypothetical protein
MIPVPAEELFAVVADLQAMNATMGRWTAEVRAAEPVEPLDPARADRDACRLLALTNSGEAHQVKFRSIVRTWPAWAAEATVAVLETSRLVLASLAEQRRRLVSTMAEARGKGR